MSEHWLDDVDQIVAEMRHEAQLLIDGSARSSDLVLDGSPASLTELDHFVVTNADHPEFERITLLIASAYLGEVMVRVGGGRWMSPPDQGPAPLVETRSGYRWCPVDAVRERAKDPTAPHLVQVWVHAMAGAPAPRGPVPPGASRFPGDLQQIMWSWSMLGAAQLMVDGVRVSWDESAIERLDQWCERRRRERPDLERAEDLATWAGAYLGEVLRRLLGGRWVQDPQGIGLQLSPQLTTYPTGKIVKRILDGPGDELPGYYEAMVSLTRLDLD